MKKLTFKEILEVLKAFEYDNGEELSVRNFAYENYDRDLLGLGEIKEVEQHGGEGEGSNWFSVKHFKDHDVYIKVQGYYTSHYGTDFDGWDDACTEVKPTTKTIQVFESIK